MAGMVNRNMRQEEKVYFITQIKDLFAVGACVVFISLVNCQTDAVTCQPS